VIASTTVPVSSAVAGSTLYYHQDGLGTVTELTDTNGSVVKAYAYDAYGNLLESPGTVEQPYAYTGREFDAESGLYYYRVRYYDAPCFLLMHWALSLDRQGILTIQTITCLEDMVPEWIHLIIRGNHHLKSMCVMAVVKKLESMVQRAGLINTVKVYQQQFLPNWKLPSKG
jgi:YD repeat-containing protein